MDNNKTLTGNFKNSRTCSFPGCLNKLSTYTKGDYCSTHERLEYRSTINQLEQHEKDLREARNREPIEKQALYVSRIFSSHQIITRNGFQIIVESGEEIDSVPLDLEPDLFIRFLELPESDSAYLAFVSKYGLLGLNQDRDIWMAKTMGLSKLEDNEELIVSVSRFSQELKHFFALIKVHHEGQSIKPQDRRCFEGWLKRRLGSHIVAYPMLRSDSNLKLQISSVIAPKTLAGALILQLYEFLKSEKLLRICALPGCENPTVRPKFCCDKHYDLHNVWKSRAKKNPKHFIDKLTQLFDKEELRALSNRWKSEGKLTEEEISEFISQG